MLNKMANKLNKTEVREQAKTPTWGDALNQTQEFLKNKLIDATKPPVTPNTGPKTPSFNSGGGSGSGPAPVTGVGGTGSGSAPVGGAGSGPRPIGGTPQKTVDTSMFACLLKDNSLKLSADKTFVTYVSSDNTIKWTFFSNNRININGKMGSWACNGANSYIVKKDDGSDSYTPEAGWASDNNSNTNNTNTGGSGSGGGSGTTLVDTTLTADDLKAGKSVKKGMKGKIVGDIQNLLIKLGYTNVSKSGTADEKFGSRTEKMVKDFQTANGLNDDGIVSKDTWPKLNDPAAVKNSSSSSTSALGSAQAQVPKDGETTAGTDAIIIKESLRKSLRKNLLKFN